ncbi:MAG: AgmX/PglI C-terminal domain-containing protein [Proteobacteria bacterium]|nr:AgmX/PglI C-terminal domain-containing protein [Pseudomonadota bacterium]
MRCPHCAGEILDGSRFCGLCGQPVAHAASALGDRPVSSRQRSDLPSRPAERISGGPAGRPGENSASHCLPERPDGRGAQPTEDVESKSPAGRSGRRSATRSMSLFVLPVSRGARLARVLAVLALDAVLAAAGVSMIISYAQTRDRALRAPPAERQPAMKTPAPRPAQAGNSALPRAAAGDEPTGTARREHTGRAPSSRTSSRLARNSPKRATAAKKNPSRSRSPSVTRRDSTDPTNGQSKKTAGRSRESATRRADRTPKGRSEPQPTPDEPVPHDRLDEPSHSTTNHSDDSPGPDDLASDDSAPGLLNPGSPGPGPSDSGPPSEEDIRRVTRQVSLVVSRNRTRLQRCYQSAAKASTPDRPLIGRLDIGITIAPTGQVSRVHVVKNATGSELLARCVSDLFSSWTFPVPPGGQSLELVWPLRFRAPK